MIFDKKCWRAQIVASLYMMVYLVLIKNAEAGRDRGARCDKPDYIPNGSYRLRRDRVMRINCNSGFILQGSKTIDCVRGKWDGEKPVCAKKGCKKDLEQPENGRIQIENEVKAILYCSDSYNLAGNRHSFCNGTHWDRPIGNCREHKNVVQHECDFETDDICGWTYEPREGLEWKRIMAANVFTTFKTGPRHDHTTLTANGGHYMLMESLTRQNDEVTLTSPIYDRELSLKTACCFQFYYFMYGAGVGDLLVVVKPVSLDLEEVLKNHQDLIKFKKFGNQNNIWNEAHFNIEEFEEDFQILFVAKSGRGQLSDIAVDDVKLLTGNDCRALDSKDEEDLSNEEYDSTTYESIFEMQSCVGHCFESPGSGIIRKSNYLKGLCNCDTDCEDNDTCCPDFRTVCLNELFSQTTSIVEVNESTQKSKFNKTSKTSATTTTIVTTTATKASTAMNTITTTAKPTTKTIKTTPLTMMTSTSVTTSSTTTPKPIGIKTTNIFTTRLTTPITTTSKTTPKTIARITRPTTIKTTTTRITRPITTKHKTTAATTSTRQTAQKKTTRNATVKTTTTTTLKTTTSTTPTPSTVLLRSTAVSIFSVPTSTQRTLPRSKFIEYVINDKSKMKAEKKGTSSVLLYVFFFILMLVFAGAVYKRFGEGAVAWCMIHFKPNSGSDEDSSSVSTTFKGTGVPTNDTKCVSNTKWRIKRHSFTKNIMKAPLVEEDDDDIGANGNIALKNNIYTEL